MFGSGTNIPSSLITIITDSIIGFNISLNQRSRYIDEIRLFLKGLLILILYFYYLYDSLPIELQSRRALSSYSPLFYILSLSPIYIFISQRTSSLLILGLILLLESVGGYRLGKSEFILRRRYIRRKNVQRRLSNQLVTQASIQYRILYSGIYSQSVRSFSFIGTGRAIAIRRQISAVRFRLGLQSGIQRRP